MKYTIVDTELGLIDPNPHRNLATYPWVDKKVSELMRSIDSVGFWAGMIARPKGKRAELAFGHHRLEAARRLKLVAIPLIMQELDDAAMLRFMARENGEDYNAEFLMMLNTWEGAVKFLFQNGCMHPNHGQVTETARFLGWTVQYKDQGKIGEPSSLAKTCDAAHTLIEGDLLERNDLRNLPWGEVREIVVRAQANVRILEDSGRLHGRPAALTKEAIKVVGNAAAIVADKARKGDVTRRDMRTQVDVEMSNIARTRKPKLVPLFVQFGNSLCNQIGRMLHNDAADKHINEIAKSLDKITLEEDHAVIRRLHHELDELARRADLAKRRTTLNKVVNLKTIKEDTA